MEQTPFHLSFIDKAESFCRLNQSSFIFKILKFFFKCNQAELNLLIKKIFCLSISENTYIPQENFIKKYLGLLLLPFYFFIKKEWIWKKTNKVIYNFETIDPDYFNYWFATLYDHLEGTKRITPRISANFGGREITKAKDSSVIFRDLLALFFFAPVTFLPLLFFCIRKRIDINRNYTAAVKNFILFNGYFRRYPCHHFITFADEGNHPCRYIAFHQNSLGDFIVIQNGERTYHPMFAYGMIDQYFVFGEAYVKKFKKLRVQARVFNPVGALCLNAHFNMIDQLKKRQEEIMYDILFIDQSVYPYNGFNKKSGSSILKILTHLNRFKELYPSYRIVYQLRYYPPLNSSSIKEKEIVLQTLQNYFTQDILILDNSGQGESYKNILKTNLIMTFESTIGFEAMRMGKKTLFVNYSGDPSESICADCRFQLDDEKADFTKFEKYVLKLLEMKLEQIPQVAMERHLAFDGKVQERIAASLNHHEPNR